MEKRKIMSLVKEVLDSTLFVPVGVSNRHIHLSQRDLETLFGKGYELTKLRDVNQPGQFAAEERVDIKNGDRILKNVRILGPVRSTTQLEISKTDSRTLRLNPPIRQSGDLKGSESVEIIGPKGKVTLKEGVILASRHIHMPEEIAKKFKIKDGEKYFVETTNGERDLIFKDVVIRVSENYALEFHIDTDEANAADLDNGDYAKVLV